MSFCFSNVNTVLSPFVFCDVRPEPPPTQLVGYVVCVMLVDVCCFDFCSCLFCCLLFLVGFLRRYLKLRGEFRVSIESG